MGTTTVFAAPPQEWKFGLFDCFADPMLSLKTYCCSCITYGETKAKLHNDGSCFTQALIYFCVGVCLVPCIMGGLGRGEIRNARNIEGSNVGDFVTHWCCGCCALVQENREVFA
ncbi:4839_t:CDS:2 [Diversispora eburnea]|uniref:4839_t:CDS:1 n=1 Tax=Diversispora eburnea TaxID=1213867 RepID=A0A9N9B580_9GLOM|nr:4839_t:CDS:2 [Diversispora eburnea]